LGWSLQNLPDLLGELRVCDVTYDGVNVGLVERLDGFNVNAQDKTTITHAV